MEFSISNLSNFQTWVWYGRISDIVVPQQLIAFSAAVAVTAGSTNTGIVASIQGHLNVSAHLLERIITQTRQQHVVVFSSLHVCTLSLTLIVVYLYDNNHRHR